MLTPTDKPLSIDEIKHSSVSNSVYYSSLQALGALPQPSASALGLATSTHDDSDPSFAWRGAGADRTVVARSGAAGDTNGRKFAMNPFASGTVVTAWNFTVGSNETHQEVEPTIYTQGSSPTTVVLSQRIASNGTTAIGKLWASQTDNFSTFTTGYLPMPVPNNGESFLQTADPWLTGNPYSSGVHPARMYATGVAFQTTPRETPNAIALWYSDDSGRTWSTPRESNSSLLVNRNQAYFYDKPAMGINTNIHYLGRVYVAWTRLYSGNNNLSILSIARSIDGSVFDSVTDIATGNFTGAQVLVDNTTGIIYVVYVDMNNKKMKMATVVDSNSYPYSPLWVMSTEDVTGTRSGIITPSDSDLKGGVRAHSMPSAMFFWPTGKICVAWHEMTSAGTDIFFTSKTTGGSWPSPIPLTNAANDQFMPAFDGDSNDNTLVFGYYDRSADSNNVKYGNTVLVTNDSGTNQHGPYSMTPATYDPTAVPFFSGLIGDYQGMWGWTFPSPMNTRFNSTYIRTASGSNADAWVTSLQ